MAMWIVRHDRLKVGTRVGDLWVAEAKRGLSFGDQVSRAETLVYNRRNPEAPLPVPTVSARWWMRLTGAQLSLFLLLGCSPSDRAAMQRGMCEARGDVYCAMDADRELSEYREVDCRRTKNQCVRSCQEATEGCGEGWSEAWERCIYREPPCVRECERDYRSCL